MTITPDSSRKSEFIAVILAATSGARLFPLTNNASSPKHLLPVGGKPVVLRLLQSLYDTGFTECILALSHEDNDVTVNQLLSQDSHKNLEQVSPGCVFRFRKSLEITIHVLSESCAGSAEALREIRASSTTSIGSSHWVVLPGDLIFSDSNHLSELVDRHRHFYNSTSSNEKTACTMLLADTSEQDEHGVPLKESAKQKKGGLARDEEDIEYIALSYDNNDENNSSSSSSLLQSPRVIWKQSKIDVEQDEDLVGQTPKLVLPKSRLRGQRPSTKVVVATDWMDLHVYVLSPWIIDLLQARNKTTVSLQGDVVPLLVTRQYKGKKATFGSSLEAAAEDSLTSADDSEYAVRAHVLDGWKALRVATIPSYLYACREVVSRVVQGDAKVELPPNTTVNAKFQSILMEGATLGEKVTCKSSTVGRNAKVSSRCRLNNVIVMENVEIGENCVLQNSILGAGCVIGENCNLNDCQVAPGKQVPTGTKEKGESLIDVV